MRREPRRPRRAAMTLVEVLAALAITSLILGGVVTARQRLVRQWLAADRTLAAVDTADALLARWSSTGEAELNAAGEADGFRWRTAPIPNDDAEHAGLVVMRLQLYDAVHLADPLLVVDTVWPDPHAAEGETP